MVVGLAGGQAGRDDDEVAPCRGGDGREGLRGEGVSLEEAHGEHVLGAVEGREVARRADKHAHDGVGAPTGRLGVEVSDAADIAVLDGVALVCGHGVGGQRRRA